MVNARVLLLIMIVLFSSVQFSVSTAGAFRKGVESNGGGGGGGSGGV